MVLERIAQQAPLFFLIFARLYVFFRAAPLTSSTSIPGIARIALVMMISLTIFPGVLESGSFVLSNGLQYVLLMVGEALIGLVMALFLTLMFSVFQQAGQFFSLQMGFGASQVFDPLAQIEIPLVGQFLNMIAMVIFVATDGFRRMILFGALGSFRALRATDFAAINADVMALSIDGLVSLFEQSLVLAFPILGTLFLLSVTMGLFGKAAPQMNLLMLGFPAAIGVAFLVIFLILPFLVEGFEVVIDGAFDRIELFFKAGMALREGGV